MEITSDPRYEYTDMKVLKDRSVPKEHREQGYVRPPVYSPGPLTAHHVVIASVLSEVFNVAVWPTMPTDDDGDELMVQFGPFVGCPDEYDLILQIKGLNRIRNRPDFRKILRSKVYEELGEVLLSRITNNSLILRPPSP